MSTGDVRKALSNAKEKVGSAPFLEPVEAVARDAALERASEMLGKVAVLLGSYADDSVKKGKASSDKITEHASEAGALVNQAIPSDSQNPHIVAARSALGRMAEDAQSYGSQLSNHATHVEAARDAVRAAEALVNDCTAERNTIIGSIGDTAENHALLRAMEAAREFGDQADQYPV